jgi:hypothetical protein
VKGDALRAVRFPLASSAQGRTRTTRSIV